jgi:hypothetical protein
MKMRLKILATMTLSFAKVSSTDLNQAWSTILLVDGFRSLIEHLDISKTAMHH